MSLHQISYCIFTVVSFTGTIWHKYVTTLGKDEKILLTIHGSKKKEKEKEKNSECPL